MSGVIGFSRSAPAHFFCSYGSGFDFPIRRMGEGRKAGLNKKRQVNPALKSDELGKGEAKWQLCKLY
jgi:hypothetical protein